MADVHSQTLDADAHVPLSSRDATQAERIEHLLGRCAQRDERALQELYQLVSGQLLGILMRILRRRAVAEEALQDVMVKIWERADQYVAYRGRAMAWITAIARYRAIDLLRRQQAAAPLDDAPAEALVDISAADFVDTTTSARLRKALSDCFGRNARSRRMRNLIRSHTSGDGATGTTPATMSTRRSSQRRTACSAATLPAQWRSKRRRAGPRNVPSTYCAASSSSNWGCW